VANRANAEPGASLPVIPEASLALARQILRKVLLMPIFVKPTGPGEWAYGGAAAYDGVLHGKIDHEGLFYRGGGFKIQILPPISGGSDAQFNHVLGPDMAPHAPPTRRAQSNAARPSAYFDDRFSEWNARSIHAIFSCFSIRPMRKSFVPAS
jgi:hypothetical protein